MKYLLLLPLFVLFTLNASAQKYEYDASGNRTERTGLQDTCDCVCPDEDIRESWLTITYHPLGDGACPTPSCKFTADLLIPPPYDCYSHYRVKINDTWITGMQSIQQGTSQEVLDYCVPLGNIRDLEIALYRNEIDPSPCMLTAKLSCRGAGSGGSGGGSGGGGYTCPCPKDDIKNDWLRVEVVPDDPTCPQPNQCRVIASIAIDPQFDGCWYFYRRAGDTTLYVVSEDPIVLDSCVGHGDRVNVSVDFLRYRDDDDPCTVTKSSLPCNVSCCDVFDIEFETVYVKNLETPYSGCYAKYSFTTEDNACVIEADRMSVVFYSDSLKTTILPTFMGRIAVASPSSTIYYEIFVDGTSCGIVKSQTLLCDCDCAGAQSFFTAEAVADTNCDDTECGIVFNIDMNQLDPCYTSFMLRDSATGNALVSSSPIGQLPAEVSQLNTCLDKADYKAVTLVLKTNSGFTCSITASAFCPVEEADPSTACVPDCPQDTFEIQETLVMTPKMCEDCKVFISYSTRISCNGDKDIQILGLHKVSTTPGACAACDEKDIHLEAIHFIVNQNEMEFDMPTGINECDTLFRVSQANCWGHYIKYETVKIGGHEVIRSTIVNVPCASGCCVRRVRVCRKLNKLEIEPLPTPLGQAETCTPDGVYDRLPSGDILVPRSGGCHYTCDYLADLDKLNDILDGDWSDDDGPIDVSDPNLYRSALPSPDNIQQDEIVNSGTFAISHDENTVLVDFKNMTGSQNVQVAVYTVAGQLVQMQESTIAQSSETIHLQLPVVASGTYLVAVSVNGKVVTTETITIVK
jgi:hypothetical protein